MAAPWRESHVNKKSYNFTSQVVLVTGGTRGIGRAIAVAFLRAGATVIVCGRTLPEKAVTAGKNTAKFLLADIRDSSEVESLIATIERWHGRLDVLVNNAGGSPAVDPATASPRFSEAIIRLNLIAPLVISQAAYELMGRQENGGAIINISSIAAIRPSPTTAAYAAAKAGLLNLTNSLAVAWAPKVRVNAIIAGTIRTQQIDSHYDAEGIRQMECVIPAGRLGEPEEVAAACLFLASPHAAYISGATLAVHGGGERPAYLDAAVDTALNEQLPKSRERHG
jgi:NAD(P)-dependent dehydrogenase (short-subunit alcohol dehydrogenase family)